MLQDRCVEDELEPEKLKADQSVVEIDQDDFNLLESGEIIANEKQDKESFALAEIKQGIHNLK